MSRLTAKLMNARGRVTKHTCVRLEKRGRGHKRSIYPIYRCVETGSERDYGYLRGSTPLRHRHELFPGIKLVIVDPPTLKAATSPALATAA